MQIRIDKGTKVQGERSGMVKLQGDVYVDAQRGEDGCWIYEVDGQRFGCAGGLGFPLDPVSGLESGPWCHKDGLVLFI